MIDVSCMTYHPATAEQNTINMLEKSNTDEGSTTLGSTTQEGTTGGSTAKATTNNIKADRVSKPTNVSSPGQLEEGNAACR
jgi:hypothetical protein